MTRLDELNALSREEAAEEFIKCCGSSTWAKALADARPFRDLDQLLAMADRLWWKLEPADWLEAFSHHPQIGEKSSERPQHAEAARWSEEEQSGTREALAETMTALAAANRAYRERFGYIFIVCATGKSSDEMLAIIKGRLRNDPAKELRVAAEEQRRITQLRLQKLLQDSLESRV